MVGRTRMPRWLLVAAALALLALGPAMTGCTALTVVDLIAEDRTADEQSHDLDIKLALNKIYLDEGTDMFRAVSMQVWLGRVLLTGGVTEAAQKARAGELAEGLEGKGVKEVINEIQVTDEGGLGNFVASAILQRRIKGELMFAKGVNSANYSVRVVNGVAYFIGNARNQEELDRVIFLTEEFEDVTKVVSYVRIVPPD